MHHRSTERGVSRSVRGNRPSGPEGRYRADGGARPDDGSIPDPVGIDRPRAPGPAGFRLGGRPAGDASGAGYQGDRRPPPPRIGTRIYRPSRPRFPEEAGRLRGAGGDTLSVDRDVDPGQRTADDGALLGLVRPLVPARPRLSDLSSSPPQPVQGHARGDSGDPAGDPGREAHPDRRSRQDLRHHAPHLPGGA